MRMRRPIISIATAIFLVLLALFSGCEITHFDPPGDGNAFTDPAERGGDSDFVIHLPFRSMENRICVQGAFGTYSHDTPSTRYDLDLDTSNGENEEIYMPASGTAYVHSDAPMDGFGIHVNIDVGGGRYVVVAHLSAVAIADGESVTVGQLLGYEGCTGACTGDHVHLGLHEGLAMEGAGAGLSVPALYRVSDVTVGDTSPADLDARDFICGIARLGDPIDGHVYHGDLMVPTWHPSGTLVKTLGSPRVYLREGNSVRFIPEEEDFLSRGYDFRDVTVISDEELACYSAGEDLTGPGAIRAAYHGATGELWMSVDEGEGPVRQRVFTASGFYGVLASWGLPYEPVSPPPILPVADSIFDAPVRTGFARIRDGAIVREEGSPDLYVIANGWAVHIGTWETHLSLGYAGRDIVSFPDGSLTTFQGYVGDCAAGVACLTQADLLTCAGPLLPVTPESPLEEIPVGDDDDDSSEDLGDDDDDATPSGDDDSTSVEDPPGPIDDPDSCGEHDEDDDDSSESDPPPSTEVSCSAGASVCLTDQDLDGLVESLCLTDEFFVRGAAFRAAPAYALGNGRFGWELRESNLVASAGGYFCADFTPLTSARVEATLVSSLNMSGDEVDSSDPSTWVWWQNYDFCSVTSAEADLFCAWQGGFNYLIAVDWDPLTGLTPAGDGA